MLSSIVFSLLSQGLEDSREDRLQAFASRDPHRVAAANRRFQDILAIYTQALGHYFAYFLPHLAIEGDEVSFTFYF